MNIWLVFLALWLCLYLRFLSFSLFFPLCFSSVARLCFVFFWAQEVLRMWQRSRRPKSDPPTRQRNRKWAMSCMSSAVCVSPLARAAPVAAHCGRDRLMRSSGRKQTERREANIKTTRSARVTRFSFSFFFLFFLLCSLPPTCTLDYLFPISDEVEPCSRVMIAMTSRRILFKVHCFRSYGVITDSLFLNFWSNSYLLSLFFWD